MEKTLEIKDFLDFGELFEKMKVEILEKYARGKLHSEDLVSNFQKLYSTIDQLLARVGKRVESVPQGCHFSLEHENIQSICTKLLSLFESQFVGGDEDKPAHLF